MDFSEVAGVVFYTTNIKRAVKFYTEVLGLEIVESESSFVTLQTKTMKLYLHLADTVPRSEAKKELKTPQISFKVDDIDAALQHLKQAKVKTH